MALFDKVKGVVSSGSGHAGHGRISCADALRLVSEFIDGELENVPPDVVEAHFAACKACYPHLRLEQAFRAAMRRACCGQKAPAELKARLAQLISEADRQG
jgi:anti-sigma factor (TIGR02949 family)